MVFAFSEPKQRPDVDLPTELGQGRRVDDRCPQFRQLPLGQLRITVVDVVGDDESEYRVPEKLETLVRFVDRMLGAVAPVSQGKGQQIRIIEPMTQTFTERIKLFLAYQCYSPTLPCT